MTAQPQLPGVRWFVAAQRGAADRCAHRNLPFVRFYRVAAGCESLATARFFCRRRNLAAGTAVILLMAIPILRFHNEPTRMFVAGLTAWTIFTLVYIGAEMKFSLLESRMGALHVSCWARCAMVCRYSIGYFCFARKRATAILLRASRQQLPNEPAPIDFSHFTKRIPESMKLCRFQPQFRVGKSWREHEARNFAGCDFRRHGSRSFRRYPGKWIAADRSWQLREVKLLTPVVPSKIICLGRNYFDHAAEFNTFPQKSR